MTRKLLFVILALFVAGGVYCQKSALSGQAKDKKTGEAIPFTNVVVLSGETLLAGCATDIEGKYKLKDLEPGVFTIKASAVGYQTIEIDKVLFKADQTRFLDIELVTKTDQLEEVQIIAYKVPLIDKENTQTGPPVTAEDIEKMPGRSVLQVARAVKGVGRVEGKSGNIYYVDGVRVRGGSKMGVGVRSPSISGEYFLSGKVLDNKSGDAIEFAVISLYSSGKVVARTISNREGKYSIKGIRSGKFVVKVSADDFKSKSFNDFVISTNGMNNLNVKLKRD